MKSILISIFTFFVSFSAYCSTNSVETLENELQLAVRNDDSVAVYRLATDPLLAESSYATRVKAYAYEVGKFGFDKNPSLALELYLKANSLGDRDSAFYAGVLYLQESNPFYDLKLGNQLIVEAATKGSEPAQRVAAICYLDSDCDNGLKIDDIDNWFTDDSAYFHPKANATLKAALSLHSMKNKLSSTFGILQTYSEIFEEDEDYNASTSYLPAWFATNISFEQFEHWLEIGVAEKHSKAALVLSAICYLETGMCNDKTRAKELGEMAVTWSPDLSSEMSFIIDMVKPSDAQYDLFQAFGAQLSKALSGDLESALRMHFAFKKGVPSLSISPHSELADEWYSVLEKAQPSAVFEKYRIKKRIISMVSDDTHFLAGGISDGRIADTLLDIAIQKEYPDALLENATKFLKDEQYDSVFAAN